MFLQENKNECRNKTVYCIRAGVFNDLSVGWVVRKSNCQTVRVGYVFC